LKLELWLTMLGQRQPVEDDPAKDPEK
jgi:hypothetical protein